MKYPFLLGVIREKRIQVSLFLILILGFLLRLCHLGVPSLWFDELMTAGRIDYPLIQMVKNLFVSPFPPLYYIMMHLWVNIFGVSEVTLRFPSLIFSVLSIFFIFKLAKELYDEEVGLISALLFSVSPYSINYAHEAKMYSLLWFLGILSFYHFYKFTKDHNNKDLFLYILFTTMSIYTLYVGFLFMVVQNISYFIFFEKKQTKKWLLGQFIILLSYIPWIYIFFVNALQRTGIKWIPQTQNYYKRIVRVFSQTMGITLSERLFVKYFFGGLYGFLMISALVSLKYKRDKGGIFHFTKKEILILAWIIVPLLIYLIIDILIYPILVTRYIGFIHIPLVILISRGASQYNLKVKGSLLGSLLLITFLGLLYPYYQYNLKFKQEDWRGLFHLIHQKAERNALVISESKYFNKGAKYYNDGQELGLMKKGEIDQNWIDKNYESIFVIYRTGFKTKTKWPYGYTLFEDYNDGTIGFLWFKKLL
jgi:uncharacterized membrane protein